MPPQGFKRSRALWDETRRLARERNSTKEYVVAYGRAIMYELQPIRWTTTNRKMLERVVNSLRSCLGMIAYCGKNFPRFLQAVWEFLKGRTKQQWKIVFGIILYYFFIRWIHGVLDAGPIVMMITALIAIFTVGLGENEDGSLSAYSVFNRGFERILGSVDVESLLAQHVGAGAGGLMMMGGGNPIPQQQEQQRQPVAGAGVARRLPRGGDNENGEIGQDNDDDDDDETQNNNNNNRSRKSGKKARRRNLEQRREIRRQREAAMALEGGDEAMQQDRKSVV